MGLEVGLKEGLEVGLPVGLEVELAVGLEVGLPVGLEEVELAAVGLEVGESSLDGGETMPYAVKISSETPASGGVQVPPNLTSRVAGFSSELQY